MRRECLDFATYGAMPVILRLPRLTPSGRAQGFGPRDVKRRACQPLKERIGQDAGGHAAGLVVKQAKTVSVPGHLLTKKARLADACFVGKAAKMRMSAALCVHFSSDEQQMIRHQRARRTREYGYNGATSTET